MFAALSIEREALSYQDLPGMLTTWVQDAGGFAAVGLVVWFLALLLRWMLLPPGSAVRKRGFYIDPITSGGGLEQAGRATTALLRRLFALGVAVAAISYGILGLTKLPDIIAWASARFGGEMVAAAPPSPTMFWLQGLLLTVGGAAALVAALLPFFVGVAQLRWRRIWALSRLTMLEVVRRRVLWVFLLLALFFLFATWFIDTKPENQVHSYVESVYLAMSALLLMTASLLASFSIPTDVRQQTIHTVVTKPVERYEIFLGRFLGYTLVMTGVLVLMTGFSLLYVLRGVDPDARAESMKARVPIYGDLRFENTGDTSKGENVGEEWEYRSYISGPRPGQPPQYAVWSLSDLPRRLADRPDPSVRCEFTFSIYRTTTGELNKGVFCAFEAESWRWDPARRAEYTAEREQLRKQTKEHLSEQEINNRLAEKYGYYEVPSKEVVNYHTLAIDLPIGLFKNQLATADELRPRLDELQKKEHDGTLTPAENKELVQLQKNGQGPRPPLQIRARCISRTQFLGMAKYDLYLLDREQSFLVNFFKGALGIWFWLCLILGVALACSTYLSGVITWLAVLFLFLLGLSRDYVQRVALGTNEGGGPAEALIRLFTRQNLVVPLEQGTVTSMATGSDAAYRWLMRRVIDVLPDIDRYDFSNLVANGFNVSGGQLGLTLLFLIAYLIPWAILAYYLIKTREIATW